MKNEDFVSRQSAVALRIKSKPRPLIPWGFFMAIGFAMFMAIPCLIWMLVFVLYRNYPAAPPATILGELGFCLVVVALMKYQVWQERRRWSAVAKELGLECPSCHKSVYYKGHIVLETGQCWNCGVRILDA